MVRFLWLVGCNSPKTAGTRTCGHFAVPWRMSSQILLLWWATQPPIAS